MSGTRDVLETVVAERAYQDFKWGEQNHAPCAWLAILTEEVGEVARECCNYEFVDGARADALDRMRAELVQVAAVAVAFIEFIDRELGR